MSESNKLILGTHNKSLVLVNENTAIRHSAFHLAAQTANTWADFIDMTSEEEFYGIIRAILEVLEVEELFQNYLNGEDLSTYVDGLVLPLPNDEFDASIIPDYEEGEYLPNLAEEMIGWLPEEIFDNIGETKTDEEGNIYYYINPEHKELVISTFQAKGLIVEENEQLIKQLMN